MTEHSVYTGICLMQWRPCRAGERAVGATVAGAVVVGGGTVGAWCAYFLREAARGRRRPPPAGLYWRPAEGAMLVGMSNPPESPGPPPTWR
ncbi:MAG TPA: hypothetical protein VFQ44_09825 [Streptosporangiaceae bacterium]|nr:hypothetical protein [Streptosporangiaceae bacterium]